MGHTAKGVLLPYSHFSLSMKASTSASLKNIGAAIDAEYVTDMTVVASYGIMNTPALVVNEQVVSMGRVLSAASAEKLFRTLGY